MQNDFSLFLRPLTLTTWACWHSRMYRFFINTSYTYLALFTMNPLDISLFAPMLINFNPLRKFYPLLFNIQHRCLWQFNALLFSRGRLLWKIKHLALSGCLKLLVHHLLWEPKCTVWLSFIHIMRVEIYNHSTSSKGLPWVKLKSAVSSSFKRIEG